MHMEAYLVACPALHFFSIREELQLLRRLLSFPQSQLPPNKINDGNLQQMTAMGGMSRSTFLSEGAHDVTPELRLVYILISIGLVLLAGLMSGLTLGLMSMDAVDLEVGRCTIRTKFAHQMLLQIPCLIRCSGARLSN